MSVESKTLVKHLVGPACFGSEKTVNRWGAYSLLKLFYGQPAFLKVGKGEGEPSGTHEFGQSGQRPSQGKSNSESFRGGNGIITAVTRNRKQATTDGGGPWHQPGQ
jgi:hypothetical protein